MRQKWEEHIITEKVAMLKCYLSKVKSSITLKIKI